MTEQESSPLESEIVKILNELIPGLDIEVINMEGVLGIIEMLNSELLIRNPELVPMRKNSDRLIPKVCKERYEKGNINDKDDKRCPWNEVYALENLPGTGLFSYRGERKIAHLLCQLTNGCDRIHKYVKRDLIACVLMD